MSSGPISAFPSIISTPDSIRTWSLTATTRPGSSSVCFIVIEGTYDGTWGAAIARHSVLGLRCLVPDCDALLCACRIVQCARPVHRIGQPAGDRDDFAVPRRR